jgi:AraC-like DNA-binding protein
MTDFQVNNEIKNIQRVEFELSPERPISSWIAKKAKHMQDIEFDMHYPLEMGVVLNGKMERHYEGSYEELGPGNIWFCGVWEPHGYKILTEKCQHLVLILYPSLLANRSFPSSSSIELLTPFSLPAGSRPQIPKDHKETTISLARTINQCDTSSSLGRARQINLIENLILTSMEFHSPDPKNENCQSSYSELLPALQLGMNNFKPVSIHDAAISCSMHDEIFSRRFKNQFGISFSKFSLRNRLSHAAHTLSTTKTPIKVIVEHYGFTDNSHLHRLFMQHYHISPAKYRVKSNHHK